MRRGLTLGLLALASCGTEPDAPPVPRVLSVTVEPTSPTVLDRLQAVAVAEDPGGGTPQLTYTWRVGDRVLGSGSSPTLSGGFAKDQTVTVTVQATVQDRTSEPLAASVEVANAPPTPSGRVVVDPLNPRAWLSDLTCIPGGQADDPDGDETSWSFRWTVDGVPYEGPVLADEHPGDTIPGDVLREGQQWVCEATLSDGVVSVPSGEASTRVAIGVPPISGVPVAGGGFTCVLDDDRMARCWGRDGASGLASPPGERFARLYAGLAFACGLRERDLTLACWGEADFGATEPPQEMVIDVGLGVAHGCAIRPDGSLFCWGDPYEGATVPQHPGPFRAVAAGFQKSCGIDLGGIARCWGSGYGRNARPIEEPFAQVSIGSDHACGLRLDGSVACWGGNIYGQSTPPAGRFLALGARAAQSCGLRDDGAVVCWGEQDETFDIHGQSYSQGFGLHGCSRTSRGIACINTQAEGRLGAHGEDVPPTEPLFELKVGERLACGLDLAGFPICFGTYGNVGIPQEPLLTLEVGSDVACGIRESDLRPVCWGDVDRGGLAFAPDLPFVRVGVGDGVACAISQLGELACWGDEAVEPPSGVFLDVVVADVYACGRRDDRTIACWGTSDPRGVPPTGRYDAIDIDLDHGCALRRNGQITCWGGAAAPEDKEGPFTSITTASSSVCAIEETGDLRCWGDLPEAELEPPFSAELVSVDGGSDWLCGLDASGGAWCWGGIRREPVQ